VHDAALALKKLNINTTPSIKTLLQLFEEDPKSINQQIQSKMIEYYCMQQLRAQNDTAPAKVQPDTAPAKSTQVGFKTPRTKTK
jgi:hypothetical protein